MLERLVETIKNRPEEYFCELFEIVYSFLFFLRVFPFWIEVDKIIGILPVFIEKFDIHDVL